MFNSEPILRTRLTFSVKKFSRELVTDLSKPRASGDPLKIFQALGGSRFNVIWDLDLIAFGMRSPLVTLQKQYKEMRLKYYMHARKGDSDVEKLQLN